MYLNAFMGRYLWRPRLIVNAAMGRAQRLRAKWSKAVSGTSHDNWNGYCPLCRKETRFEARNAWYRDHLICASCHNGSIPRERAMMVVLDREKPDWRKLRIHESSPGNRGLSPILRRDCANYVPTQLFEGVPLGQKVHEVQCEDIERQTFPDRSFDIVITQDVMEHVFSPEMAYKEIYRTLAPGGVHIHTTPIYKALFQTERRAALNADGTIEYLAEPEYHGNPVSQSGSLVTFHFGQDLPQLITQWAPFAVERTSFDDKHRGLVAEFLDVIVCRKY